VTEPQPGRPTGDDGPDRPPSPLDAALGISQAAARYGAGLVRVSWAAAAATVEALTAPLRPRPGAGSAPPTSPASAQPGAAVSTQGGPDSTSAAEPAPAAVVPEGEAPALPVDGTAGAGEARAVEPCEGETRTDGTTASESDSIEAEVAASVVADLGETDRLPPEQPPIPRWDELTLASIRGRLARLDEVQLEALHAWEQSHAGRPAVLSMLENRMAKLRLTAGAGGGADPGGDRG